MKSTFLLCLAGLLGLGACSNDDVVNVKQPGAIQLHPLVENSTRATETTVGNLGSFKVTALKDGESYGEMTVTNTGTEGSTVWTVSPKTYWPDNAAQELHFYAYAPTTDMNVTIDGTSKKISAYTPSETVADQKDLVIAYNTGTKAANEAGGVDMFFKHALAQIEVKAKCSSSNMKVEIIGVKIAQVVKSGDFTFPSAKTEAGVGKELASALWTVGSEKTSYMTQGTSPVTLTSAVQSVMPAGNGNFMVIPQNVTSWNSGNNMSTNGGSYISVLCRITNVSGNNETQIFPSAAGKYGFSAVAIGTTADDKVWKPGKKYVYTLEFFGNNSGGGKYDPEPDVPGGEDPTIDPTDPTKGGEDILKPITFTVDVEEWTELPVDLPM